MKRAFTIVELLVGLALMVALMAASGVIFSMAVKTQRTAAATAEIAQKLVVLTNRLTADLHGLQKDAPIAIWFELDTATGSRYDQLMFFANGDFQTIRQYNNGSGNVTINGNTARVYYGHADNINFADRTNVIKPTIQNYRLFRTLVRRQHVLTADAGLAVFPDPDPANFITSPVLLAAPFVPFKIQQGPPVQYEGNDYFEYDTLSVNQWQNILNLTAGGVPVNSNWFIEVCFDNMDDTSGDNIRNKIDGRAGIDLSRSETLHMLMAQGIGSFSIQWSYYTPAGLLRWRPGSDPDGNPATNDSHFTAVGRNAMGIYFNMPSALAADTDGAAGDDWFYPAEFGTPWQDLQFDFFPTALKFTFTLYDSKGIFPEGKTFTHIVYLND